MKIGISLEEAVALLKENAAPIGTEEVALHDALGRTLAQDIIAEIDQPPFSRSPLDGYALRAEDTVSASKETPVMLSVVDRVYAGQTPSCAVGAGEAIKVTTGAMLPEGCSCVLRQEATDQGEPILAVYESLKAGVNVCHQGEEYRAGAILLQKGTRMDAAALGVLASAGYTGTVEVCRHPLIGLVSTGDEVVSVGTHPLPAGKIYGSNEYYLSARLRELGIDRVICVSAPDDPKQVADSLAELSNQCDLIITTGGVSVGEKDIFHQALPLLGAEQIFWKVNLKPGTPAMYSRWKGIPILSLSGNPFAAAATFELLARPLLAELTGETCFETVQTKALLASEFWKPSPQRRFIRGRYQCGWVWLPEEHASGQLRSAVGCNCLVEVPARSGPLTTTDEVTVVLLNEVNYGSEIESF